MLVFRAKHVGRREGEGIVLVNTSQPNSVQVNSLGVAFFARKDSTIDKEVRRSERGLGGNNTTKHNKQTSFFFFFVFFL
jgi:hypothetical protein